MLSLKPWKQSYNFNKMKHLLLILFVAISYVTYGQAVFTGNGGHVTITSKNGEVGYDEIGEPMFKDSTIHVTFFFRKDLVPYSVYVKNVSNAPIIVRDSKNLASGEDYFADVVTDNPPLDGKLYNSETAFLDIKPSPYHSLHMFDKGDKGSISLWFIINGRAVMYYFCFKLVRD